MFHVFIKKVNSTSTYNCLVHWKRYVDDTHVYIKPDKVDHVLKKLNTYHKQIQFTYELQKDQGISFLDVSIRRRTISNRETIVIRKETNTDVYMNWKSYTHMQWKIGTSKI